MGKGLNGDGLVLGWRAILAIDLDKTVFDSDFPVINGLMPNAKDAINRLISEHDCYVIAWTSRNNESVAEAKEYLDASGINYDAFNENHPALKIVFNGDSRKVGADIYIDDKNLQSLLDPDFPDWLKIEQQVISVIYAPNFWTMLNHSIEGLDA